MKKSFTSPLSEWRKREKKQTTLIIPKAPEGVAIPLTSGQQRLWFLQKLLPDNPVYNYSECFVLKGELNCEAFAQGLQHVFVENTILRSTYPNENGKPIQIIHEGQEIRLNKYDLSTVSPKEKEREKLKILLADAKLHFRLDEFPLVRTTLIKLSKAEHVFLMTMHHIVFDKWSMDLFIRELAAKYRAIIAGDPVVKNRDRLQFSDYAFWLRNKEVDDSQIAYWKTKLDGEHTSLELPEDYPQPSRPSYKGTSYRSQFPIDLSTRILNLSKKVDTTPYVLLLSVYYLLLHKYSGQQDIWVGSPISQRENSALENIIGFFDETIVLRNSIRPEMTFTELVKEVRMTTLEAFANKDVPFDVLVKELKPRRSLNVNPFFRVMFIYHSVQKTPSFGAGLELSHSFFNPGVSKFDLTLFVANEEGKLSSGFEYSSDIFRESTIIQFQEHLTLLLEAVTSNPNQKIADIEMLTPRERNLFFPESDEIVHTFQEYRGIHEIIESVSKSCPDQTALIFRNETITYKTLNEKADALAMALLDNISGRNEKVGLCIDQSLEMVIGLLAILKAGCAYVPLDLNYPKDRLEFILEDAGCNLVLTQTSLKGYFKEFDKRVVYIDGKQIFKGTPATGLPSARKDDIAYLIYTSGSTGIPKGVPISHNNIISSTAGRLEYYPENPEVFLLLSSISFDSSKAGIFWTLCTGGTLVIAEKRIEQDIHKMCELISSNNVSHTLMLPTLYKLVLEYADLTKLKTLDTVIVAGETCNPSLPGTHFEKLPEVKLYNEYGPTEATVWCAAHRIRAEENGAAVPIGKPVANSQLYLLNEHLQLVPNGAVGEIYIGGPGLTSGYIKRPELTRKSIIRNPFDIAQERKLYKTGDRGRYDHNGNIQFLGRIDEQVKIRGFRIELGEVEKAILQNQAIDIAVVLLEEIGSAKRLIAFVKANESLDLIALKSDLKKLLPHFMIPSVIYPISEFPLLPNGKIDKKSLLLLGRPSLQSDLVESDLPLSSVGKKLAEIWQEVLGLNSIGVNDNFFEIGGDSILSIQFISRARKMGFPIEPNLLFEYQTISSLSNYLQNKDIVKEKLEFVVPLRKHGSKKALFCIHSGGGHVFFYGLLAKYLKSDRPIYALEPSGLYNNTILHNCVEEMTSDYLKSIRLIQPHGPYNILTYCFSIAVGNEMAIQLANMGEEINLIVIDTMATAWNNNTAVKLPVRIQSFFKRLLYSPRATIKYFFESRRHLLDSVLVKFMGNEDQKNLEKLKARLRKISMIYQWRKHPGQVSLLVTDERDTLNQKHIIKSWQDLALGGVKVFPSKGSHNTLFEEPDIQFVSEIIDKTIID